MSNSRRTVGLAIAVGLGVVGAVVVWWLRTERGRTPDARPPASLVPSRTARAGDLPTNANNAKKLTIRTSGDVGSDPLALSGSDRPIIRDPTSPDYDAGRLYAVSWSDGEGIFKAEPRREPWASDREYEFNDAIADELRSVDPDAKVEITCHTSSCVVHVSSTKAMLVEELGQYPIVYVSSFVEPDFHPEAGYADYYVMFGASNLSSEGFQKQREAECPKWRDEFIKDRNGSR